MKRTTMWAANPMGTMLESKTAEVSPSLPRRRKSQSWLTDDAEVGRPMHSHGGVDNSSKTLRKHGAASGRVVLSTYGSTDPHLPFGYSHEAAVSTRRVVSARRLPRNSPSVETEGPGPSSVVRSLDRGAV